MAGDREKLNRVEELKSKLFSKNYEPKIERRDKFSPSSRKDVPESWPDESESGVAGRRAHPEKFFMKTSIFKNFFIFSMIFFTLTLGYAAYMFFVGGNTVSNDNIDIAVQGNNYTAGGEQLSLVIGITNRNSSALNLVDLVVEYPKSYSGAGQGGTERLRQSLGTIPAGGAHNENVKVVLFGEQGSILPVKIFLEYRVEGSSGIFVKEKPYEVTISATPLNIIVDAPLATSPNQDLTLDIKTVLNATYAVPATLVAVNYPVGFQFISSTPKPSFGNNIWSLGDLAPGAERNISITGRMVDVFDGEEKIFHVSAGSQSRSDKSVIGVVFNSLAHAVEIRKPFIEAKLFVNGVYQKEYATNTGTRVNGEIRWANNLDTKINDLEIRARISGNAADRRTISAQQGFYDSTTDVIIWDKNSQTRLAEVNPGDSGSVSFSVSPASVFSAENGILSDPTIRVEIAISGKQLIQGYETAELSNSESAVIRVVADVGFATRALHYSGPLQNTGPVPPKAEQETSYTVAWSLSNTANNISKAVVRSSLPQWVKFAGAVSPESENLTYNATTREIVWNVGQIPRGTGITAADRTVYFQITFTPSLSQVRTTPIIINDAILTGYDDFAKVDVRVSKPALRTQLYSDPLFPANGGTVIE